MKFVISSIVNVSFFSASTLIIVNELFAMVPSVEGHGYVTKPIARNLVANQIGLSWGSEEGKPPKEYCEHCLNTKIAGSVCGTSEQDINYDDWLDSVQKPMPWISGETYTEGDTITIKSYLSVHHTGHMEVRACPNGRDSTQECFDDNLLEFVKDVAYKMPKDFNYPERGYYYGDYSFDHEEFIMEFKLPDNLVGEEVLFQWLYVTANSCSPVGYAEYYELNSDLPDAFWNKNLGTCTPDQFPPVFATGDSPERFVNCAEVSILPKTSSSESPSGSPLSMPSASTASPSAGPTDVCPSACSNKPAPSPPPSKMCEDRQGKFFQWKNKKGLKNCKWIATQKKICDNNGVDGNQSLWQSCPKSCDRCADL